MSVLKNKRGLLLTVAAALFVIVIFGILLVRLEQSREQGESTVYRVRCDELNSFLDDITKDLGRATSISSTRALIFAIGTVVTNGTPLSDAAKDLNELTLNASFKGNLAPDLQNQTLKNWTVKITNLAVQRDFTTNLDVSLMEMDSVPHTSWEYWARVRINNLTIRDNLGYCSFNGALPRGKKWVNANVSIRGYEDPLYVLRTNGYTTRGVIRDNVSVGNHSNTVYINTDIVQKLYHPSQDGPSFFERLENKLGSPVDSARHNYYLNKTQQAFADEGININTSNITIGLETFVDVNEMQTFIPQEIQSEIIKVNQTVVDHLFFGPALQGKKVVNVSNSYSWFRIDTATHKDFYNLSDNQLYE
ncbi:TPA: hypothetical protein H1005_02215 [archaeon]|nr:hypothetical protein [Candidatus Naiadarchaeales archaeon SRR2090153.bin1042]